MRTAINHDLGRIYGEYILFWLIENANDGRQVEDHEMQEGSGLPDVEFRIGLDWLIEQEVLDRRDERIH